MAVACKEGDTDGKKFFEYVDYIVKNVVPISSAKTSIDKIRTIGNDANHDITFVSEQDAKVRDGNSSLCPERGVFSPRCLNRRQQFFQIPNMIRDASGHRRGNP